MRKFNRQAIMQQAEKELKRIKPYRNKIKKGLDTYKLQFVMISDKYPKPYDITAYAKVGERILAYSPYGNLENKLVKYDWVWSYDVDYDFFGFLEKGYDIAGVTLDGHLNIWNEMTDRLKVLKNASVDGMQQYLQYCKDNGITKEKLQKEVGYSGDDIMRLYKNHTRKKDDYER